MRGDKTTGFVARLGLRFAMVWASATLGSFGLGHAQEPAGGVEAPSRFQRVEDTATPTMGDEDEADAGAAQAEAIERGEPTPGLDGPAREEVEQIVVQARRRAELLEDTPVAISVLSETTLRESGIFRTDEIQELVPNMTIVGGLSGQLVQIFIRGIGATNTEAVFEPGVGFYLDGVFMPAAGGQIIDTVDVAQIEVLRGPQGTLFGKNTVGGAVNVTTVKPDEELEAFALVRPGNFGSVITRGILNLPIWEDRILSRFAFATENDGGYMFNDFREESANFNNAQSFLGSLRFLPTDDLTIDWSGMYSSVQNGARSGQCVMQYDGPLLPLLPGFKEACEETTAFVNSADVDQLNRVTRAGTWGIIQYDGGTVGPIDDVLVKSITGWHHQEVANRTDIDQTRIDFGGTSATGGPLITDGEPGEGTQIQQEVQLNGSAWDGRINFVTGLFTFWERSESGIVLFADFLDVNTLNQVDTDNFAWALYGQATADFTEWLSLTAGVRYTSDEKSFTQRVANLSNPDLPPEMGSDSKTFTSWTPTATLALTSPEDWLIDTPVDHLMGYFTYSQGFKGGGFNATFQPQVGVIEPEPFDPETVDNYEIGIKTIGFDQMLTVNLALFYMNYDDIQVTTFDVDVDPVTGELAASQVTKNAAKAKSKGIELELVSQPIEGLLITGSVGVLDAKYDEFPDAVNQLDNQPIDRSGQTFPLSPKYQTFLAVQYSFPVEVEPSSWLSGWLTPRLEWAYRDRYFILGPEFTKGFQSGYNLLNARLSYDFLDDRAQVALWAQNLLDEAYFNSGFGLGPTVGSLTRYYEWPRTFGAELSYKF